MTLLKRLGMLVAALIMMSGVTELGGHLLHERGSRLCLNRGGRRWPTSDPGQCGRRRAAVGAA